jgi:molybdate transport system substrate-binding protein
MRKFLAHAVILGWTLTAGVALASPPASEQITVFAAASLTETIQQAAAEFQNATGISVRASFASSATLARQIEAGAKADLFISADGAWMDYLDEHHALAPGTRHTLLTNRLVLITRAGSLISLKLGPEAPLVSALKGGRLAMADPDTVPAGRYAKAAFTYFGIWKDLEPHIVRAEDVRVALAWVTRGEAPLGVVYATDAQVEPRVRVLDTFPAASHPPIVYPISLVAGASAASSRFVSFLESPAGRAVFLKAGFTLP